MGKIEHNSKEELQERIETAIKFIENFSLKNSEGNFITAKQWRELLVKILRGE